MMQVCPRALKAQCDTYDGWEVDKQCVDGTYAKCKHYPKGDEN